eukprot:gene8906-1596_t
MLRNFLTAAIMDFASPVASFHAEPSARLDCVAPGRCAPPSTQYSRVLPITPRQQWNINGGFCGAVSFQASMLAFGAWVSQDLVRKANTFGSGHCGLDHHPSLGCEVDALNLGETALNLK